MTPMQHGHEPAAELQHAMIDQGHAATPAAIPSQELHHAAIAGTVGNAVISLRVP
jgi:hypothetical protein